MSFTQAMMAENAELKKQLKFEQEQVGLIFQKSQALLAENEKLLTFKNAIMEEMGDEDMSLDDISTAVMDMNKDRIDAEEENETLKEQIDELESEVLDARESFNLQQQSDLFYCRGHIYCDPETGENMNRDKLFAIYKDGGKLKAENEKLKKSEKILEAYNEYICEGQGWDWFIYEISDEDKQMFLDAGMDEDNFE